MRCNCRSGKTRFPLHAYKSRTYYSGKPLNLLHPLRYSLHFSLRYHHASAELSYIPGTPFRPRRIYPSRVTPPCRGIGGTSTTCHNT
ncbi:hypothetical protein AYI69_g3497 [Smittium culicis]|uniref:Uncharacterized protein n=1 Tax=Smittium culicis TaxID=133412 RepID=A0A1R1YJI8_9FUNG|nr:hypothetical protein AYI69_g3497 [Smittium culicis]